MRQLFLLDNICSMHTSTVNKSYFIKDLACGPSLGLQNLMWPSGLKSLPTSGLGGEIRFSWRCEYRLNGGSKPLYENMIHKLGTALAG